MIEKRGIRTKTFYTPTHIECEETLGMLYCILNKEEVDTGNSLRKHHGYKHYNTSP